MALEDCINKLGVVSREDKARLRLFLDEGMTDKQAVRRLLIESSANVVSVAARAKDAGATVNVPNDTLAEIRDFSDKRLRGLVTKRADIEGQMAELNAAYRDMTQNLSMFEEILAQGKEMDALENLDDGDISMRIGQIMFDEVRRNAMARGVLGIQGTTTKEVLNSYKSYRQGVIENRKALKPLLESFSNVNGQIDKMIGDNTMFQSTQSAERNQIGLYSALEQAALDMNIPEWKPRKSQRKIYTPEMEARRKEVADAISVRFDEIKDTGDSQGITDPTKLPEWKELNELDSARREQEGVDAEGPRASGKSIMQKLFKMDGVKKEEIKWSGIEEFLSQKYTDGENAGKPVKFTRDEVAKFIRENTVEVESTETYEDADAIPIDSLEWDRGTVWEDSEAWDSHADDLVDEFKEIMSPQASQNDVSWIDPQDFWAEMEEEIADDYDFSEDQRAEMDGTGDTLDMIADELGYNLMDDYEAQATEWAKTKADEYAYASYMRAPLYIYATTGGSSEIDLYIFGNDEQGYSIREGGWESYSNDLGLGEIYSLNEAEIQAEAYARDHDMLAENDADENENIARWEDYVEDGYNNYREVKIKLPEVEGAFVERNHFGDEENIVTFLRVTDRNLSMMPMLPGPYRQVGIPDGMDPADVGLKEVPIQDAYLAYQSGGLVLLGSRTDTGHNVTRLRGETNSYIQKLLTDKDKAEAKGDKFYVPLGNAAPTDTFFVDEQQSDWHQKGYQYGYVDKETMLSLDDRETQIGRELGEISDNLYAEFKDSEIAAVMEDVTNPANFRAAMNLVVSRKDPLKAELGVNAVAWITQSGDRDLILKYKELTQERKDVRDLRYEASEGVPEAPFKDDAWITLGLKRALVMAAEQGSNQFAFADAQMVVNRWGDHYESVYETQYNKKMPSIIKKLTGLQPKHVDMDGGPVQEGQSGMWIIELPNSLRQKIKGEGLPLFQDRRGSITWERDAQGRVRNATINLFEASDLSTFIHEAGHLYLEIFRILSSRPDASERILRDTETLLNYLGVENFDQVERKHHEMFAETFEKYTMDGKAPTTALQDAFGAFRTWFLEIYKNIKSVRGIEVPDDVREVFDRMLATDEEIALAEATQEYAPLFSTAEEMGVSQETFEVYKRSIIRAHNDAVAKESAKLLKAMKRDQRAWWDEEYKKEEARVRAEANEMRVFKARAFLQTGKLPDGSSAGFGAFKLDRDSVLDVLNGDETLMKMLPHSGKSSVYTTTGGVDADIAATWLGYQDGQEMIGELLQAPPINRWVKITAKARMTEKYPDPFKDGSMIGAALKAVHDTKRSEIITAEMRELRRLSREDKPAVKAEQDKTKRERKEAIAANKGQMPKRDEMRMFRQAAAEKIASMKIRRVKPHVYLNAERKFANEAFAAWNRGDIEGAYDAKRNQMINFEMYRAAVKAADQMQKSRDYMAKFDNKRTQEKMGKGGVLNQILGILEGIDLRKRSLSQVDYLEAMKDLREAVDSGKMIVTPETLALIKSDLVNWQDLTVDQFRAMKELVQQLEHEADRTVYAYLNDEKVKLDDIITELEGSIYDNNKTVDLYGGHKNKGEGFKKAKDQAITSWLRPGSIARILDQSEWGAFTKRFINPIRRAYAEKLIPNLHKLQEDMSDLYLSHFSLKDLQQLKKRNITVQGQNKKYSKADAIALALNQGNEGNKRAVAGSLANEKPIYPKQVVDQLLGTLTESDWNFVQGVWDYMETYWPQIKEAEERRRGVAPEQVPAQTLTVRTADGKVLTLRGGYYPLVYDTELSDRVKHDDFDAINTKMGLGVYVTANTRSGATYERVKNHGLPVRLDLNVIDQHLREVIRDLALGDEVNAVSRVINDKRFRAAMRETDNMAALKELNLWITDAAVGELPANHIATRSARYIRGGFVKAKLGLSGTVTMLQFTGFFQTMAAVGTKDLAFGVGKLMSNPQKWWRYVEEKSKFIHARYEVGAWNRDVQDVQTHIDSFFGAAPTVGKRAFSLLGASLFMPIKYAQKVVDIATWLAGYHQGLNTQGLSDQEAIHYADSMVEKSQTSGFFGDRSGLERGTLSENVRQAEYVRIWTTLIGYMLAKGNIAYEKTKQVKWSKPSNVLQWLGDMVLLFTLEGMASAILYGNWPEEDDDGEKQWKKWAAGSTVDSIASGVPFIREIPQQRYGSGSTPIGALSKDILTVYDQSAQGEADEAWIKAISNVLGTTLHLPSAQTNRTLEAIWDEGETTLPEYITGPRDDEE